MARSRELEQVKNIVAVGIRSMDSSEISSQQKADTFFAHEIFNNHSWMDRAIDRLQPKVYLTFDLDVFCPGIMPSTGTPEPGGLDWWTAITFLRKVIENRQLIGFDVVELSPTANPAPDFMAAKLVYSLFSYLGCSDQPA
jgi:agmatinase